VKGGPPGDGGTADTLVNGQIGTTAESTLIHPARPANRPLSFPKSFEQFFNLPPELGAGPEGSQLLP